MRAEVLVDAPLREDQLPKIVLPELVVHAMEKVLVTHGGLRLVLRVAATGRTYQVAERRLWAVLRGEAGECGGIECCAVLEYEAVAAPIPRFFLTRAADALRLLISLGLLRVPGSRVQLRCPDLGAARGIWTAGFLARSLVHMDPEEAGVLCDRMMDALEQGPWRGVPATAESGQAESGAGSAASSIGTNLADWGVLWERKAAHPEATDLLRECPTSGSMPRLYRPPPTARHFIVRPKLFFLTGVSAAVASLASSC